MRSLLALAELAKDVPAVSCKTHDFDVARIRSVSYTHLLEPQRLQFSPCGAVLRALTACIARCTQFAK